MALSIITPHYNDSAGLKRVYQCLVRQSYSKWQWIIVDDSSEQTVYSEIRRWYAQLNDARVELVFNDQKSNASVCRNQGADIAKYDNLIFLDADDEITPDFIANRKIVFKDFAVFKNILIVDKNGTQEVKPNLVKNPLDYFLEANFVWQTTAILWKKAFFVEIGKFDPNLHRLQDVELSIRALMQSENYQIINNEIDFLYNAKPIRLKTDIVKKSCSSVNHLILKIDNNYKLNAYRHSLIKSFYFACVKGLHRCKNREDVPYVQKSLKLFYKKGFIDTKEYLVGKILLLLYRFGMISDSLFIRINRYFFK